MTAPAFERRLAAAALAYAVCHHVGSLPRGLGEVGETRWADWIDLATPYLLLLPAAWALAAAGPGRRLWTAFAAGAVLYTQGHGIHLAANSIGNVAPSPAAHLWDEPVGHALWYTGVAVVLAVLAVAASRRPRPGGWVLVAGVVLALSVGGTWVTNALGGGYAVPALAVALGLGAFGWRHRDGLAVLYAVAFAPAVVALAVYLGVQATG